MSSVRLGSFEVEEKIASGGMGDIWRGRHVVQGVPVAIKVIRQDGSEDESFTRDFRREVRAVAQLDHPAIVTLFDIGDVPVEVENASAGALEAGNPYLVMEYLERGSLEGLEFPLPWLRAREILMATLDGLAHAHARGITHRDLKPGNLLVGEDASGSKIRITDFGIAFSYEERRSARTAGRVIGTPPYMAPEQFMGEWREFGPWTDLYALGCVAYQISSGRVPFQQRDVMQLGSAHIGQPPPALDCPPDYPAAFQPWVMKLLAKDATLRYRRCADAAGALASLPPTPPRSGLEIPGSSPDSDGFVATSFSGRGETGDANGDWIAPAPPARPFKLVGAGLRLFSFRSIPLVGRDPERHLMWRMVKHVSEERTPAVLVLEGAAGTGKSRLAEWFCERMHEMGVADRLEGEHDRSARREFGLSYMMARAWSCLGATAPELQRRVDVVLSSAGIQAPTIQRAIVEFLAPASLGDDFRPGMFHQFGSREERFSVLFEVLRKLYRERPLVVWLDDVHWGTESLRFIRYVLQRASNEPMPMMAVLTAREDLLVEVREADSLLRKLSGHKDARRVRLAPLPDRDIRLLVSNLLYLQGDLAERVAVRSGGNPLYATQLVGDWVNRGVLEPGVSGFVLSGREDVDIPDDVHAVWVQRLERVLDESAGTAVTTSRPVVQRLSMQIALEIAVALGGRVSMEEWMSTCSLAGVSDPMPVLESLLASRMARLDATGWSFNHTMLRDSVERIAREKRRWTSHNRLCADMLEQRRPVPHWGDSERIGRHRFEAGQFEAAVRPLLRGARERRRLEEYSAALWLLALYDRALDGLRTSDSDYRRLDGWLLQADINCTRRELKDAEELAIRVRSLATGADANRSRATALFVLGRVHQHQGRVRTALGEFAEAQRALRATGPKHYLAKCLSEQAHALLESGRLDQAWKAFNEAQEIYEDVGRLVPWVENQLGLARVALRQGDTNRAVTLCRRVRNFARREGLNRLEAAAWVVLAEIEMDAGALVEAEHSLEKSIALLEQLGLPLHALHPRLLQTLIWLESGAVERAKLAFDRMRDSPEVEVPRVSRLFMRCVDVAVTVDASADEFRSAFDEAAARVVEAEQLPPEVTRCLRLAVERARQKGFPDRASRVNDLWKSQDGPGVSES